MSPTSGHTENILLTVVIQLMLIIAASRLFGLLFRKIGQPLVCGEIAAGLILGPSVFGGMFPGLFHRVFDPSVGQTFAILSQIGLVLLMFLIGLEFDFGHLTENRRTAMSVSVAGILLPFTLGFVLGKGMHAALGLQGSWVTYLTTPVLRRLARSSELEPDYLRSEFAARRQLAAAREGA